MMVIVTFNLPSKNTFMFLPEYLSHPPSLGGSLFFLSFFWDLFSSLFFSLAFLSFLLLFFLLFYFLFFNVSPLFPFSPLFRFCCSAPFNPHPWFNQHLTDCQIAKSP